MQSITCKQLIDFLDDFIAGTQPADVRRNFEHHLSICKHCVDYLRMYEETVRFGRVAFQDDPAAPLANSVPEDLVKAVLAATARKR